MFDWASDLELAEELAGQVGNEAAERSAISRAYYAAFGAARRYLDGTGMRVPRASSAHAVVWDRFHSTPDSVHRRIADIGRRLKRRRGRADYDDVYPGLSVDAQNAVALARRLLADVARLPESS